MPAELIAATEDKRVAAASFRYFKATSVFIGLTKSTVGISGAWRVVPVFLNGYWRNTGAG